MISATEKSGKVPERPRIYHIIHADRLPSVWSAGYLWSDAEVQRRQLGGTTIGMHDIKRRRLTELTLLSHPGLSVGDCVPFYFCPRSVMLYLLHKGNHPGLGYTDGQDLIVHLEADLHAVAAWAESQGKRWAFTLSNAGAYYFEDRCDLRQLNQIDWSAVHARDWSSCKEGKQAEFLLESAFPVGLIERIGVRTRRMYDHIQKTLDASTHGTRPVVTVEPSWYY